MRRRVAPCSDEQARDGIVRHPDDSVCDEAGPRHPLELSPLVAPLLLLCNSLITQNKTVSVVTVSYYLVDFTDVGRRIGVHCRSRHDFVGEGPQLVLWIG